MRHYSRRVRRHPSRYYVTPTLLSGGGTDPRGFPVPEARSALPEALFVPGPSTEEGLLSNVSDQRAQLFFHTHVEVRSTDRVELVDPFGNTVRWQVSGRAKHWPRGTEVVLEVPS